MFFFSVREKEGVMEGFWGVGGRKLYGFIQGDLVLQFSYGDYLLGQREIGVVFCILSVEQWFWFGIVGDRRS